MSVFTRRQIVLALASAPGAALWPGQRSLASSRPIIAAAASLRFVLPEIAEAFRNATGAGLRLSFASSGNLTRQIRQGAPFELFLSADEDYVKALARDGVTPDAGVLYAHGQLAVFAANSSPVGTDPALAGIRSALRSGALKRFAIANPDHAPYGRAAREALMHSGLWQPLQKKLVFGENVSQAAQFAASASCEAAIIAHSVANAPAFSGKARFSRIPDSWHKPLRQRMVMLPGASESVRRFYGFLQEKTAQAIFARHGFAQPKEV